MPTTNTLKIIPISNPNHTYSPEKAINKAINNDDAISGLLLGIASATYAQAKPVKTRVKFK